MELEAAVNKYESALRTYRAIYTFLEFTTTFFTLYLLFTLFNMQDIFTIIPFFEPYTGTKYNFLGSELLFETLGILLAELGLAAIITVVRQLRKEKKDAIKLLEEKYPTLKERLSTAYDNRNVDNLIVKDLLGTVKLEIKPLTSSALLDRRLLLIGIGALFLTASTSTYITLTDYHTEMTPKNLPDAMENIPFISSNKDKDLFSLEGNEAGNKGKDTSEDLFSEPAVIVVEGTEIDLKIPPGTSPGLTIGEEGEERKDAFGQSAADDPEAIASQAYYENLPEGYQNIIQSYFEEMAEAE